MKKFLISGLTVFVVMWAVGVASFVAVPFASAAVGDLVKSASSNTVYVVSADGVTICQFPHSNVYSSWGYPANFSTVITKDLSSYTMGSNVEFRDASLVKGDGPAVYMVYNNMKRPIVSDVVFLALGYDWDDITWLSDAFLADYTTGADVNDSSTHPDGQIVKYASNPAVYLLDGGQKRAFQSAAAFEANRFGWGDIITIPDTETYPAGSLVTGYEQSLSLPTCIGSVTPTGSGLTVALSPATPAATSVIADSTNGGQALVPFTTVNFTASSDGDVKVNTLKFKRTGISSDTSLDSLYLYEGSTKLTDGGSLSSAQVTFNDASGIFTVPAGTTKSVTVKGDINKSTSAGNTIGFTLESATGVTTNGAAVSGSFPASGNLMTVATVTDFGKMYITTSSVDTAPNPDTQDVEVWKATFYSSNQKVGLNYLKFTSLGSIQFDDLSNFKLYDGGTLVATASMNSDREVIFDLTGSPVNFTVGQSKLIKLLADVDKGSGRTYNFTLQEATDVVVMDQNYNAYLAPYPGYLTVGNWAVIKMTTDSTIQAGSLSVTKNTSSPTGNVSQDGTNILLGKWDLQATGEDMKVKNFDVNLASSGAGEGGLDNGKLFYNGVQVGSTQDLTEATDVNFTFGSSLIVPAGTTGVLDLYADIKSTTSSQLQSGGTLAASIGAGSSNVQKMNSLDYGSYPGSDVAANTLTISAGSLTISEYSGYGDQTMVAGTSNAKVASAVFQAGSAEGVNVTSITVTLSTVEAASTTNLLLMKGGVQIGTTKVVPGASNIVSVNFDVPKSGSTIVDVYVNFKSSANAGPWTSAVYGEGSGLTTSNAVTGGSTSDNMQTITLSTGSLTFTSAASKPTSDIVVAGSSKVKLNAVKFSALYEDFEVQEVTVSTTAGMLDDFSKVYLEYPTQAGGTGTAEGYLVSNVVTFTGLNMFVPKDGNATLDIFADIQTIANGADSGDEGDLTLAVNNAQTFKAVGLGSGTVDSDPDDSSGAVQSQVDVAGNDMVLRKTRPTVTLATLPTTTLSNGTKTISKFTVSADAKADVSLYEIEWDFATSGAAMTLSSAQLYDNANPSTALTASGTPAFTHTNGGTIKFQLNSEEVISAGSSKTYFLTVTVTGSDGSDSLLTRLRTPYTTTVTTNAYDAAVNATFVWSDNSAASHSYTTSDWANAEFVKTLPSDYQTMSNN